MNIWFGRNWQTDTCEGFADLCPRCGRHLRMKHRSAFVRRCRHCRVEYHVRFPTTYNEFLDGWRDIPIMEDKDIDFLEMRRMASDRTQCICRQCIKSIPDATYHFYSEEEGYIGPFCSKECAERFKTTYEKVCVKR